MTGKPDSKANTSESSESLNMSLVDFNDPTFWLYIQFLLENIECLYEELSESESEASASSPLMVRRNYSVQSRFPQLSSEPGTRKKELVSLLEMHLQSVDSLINALTLSSSADKNIVPQSLRKYEPIVFESRELVASIARKRSEPSVVLEEVRPSAEVVSGHAESLPPSAAILPFIEQVEEESVASEEPLLPNDDESESKMPTYDKWIEESKGKPSFGKKILRAFGFAKRPKMLEAIDEMMAHYDQGADEGTQLRFLYQLNILLVNITAELSRTNQLSSDNGALISGLSVSVSAELNRYNKKANLGEMKDSINYNLNTYDEPDKPITERYLSDAKALEIKVSFPWYKRFSKQPASITGLNGGIKRLETLKTFEFKDIDNIKPRELTSIIYTMEGIIDLAEKCLNDKNVPFEVYPKIHEIIKLASWESARASKLHLARAQDIKARRQSEIEALFKGDLTAVLTSHYSEISGLQTGEEKKIPLKLEHAAQPIQASIRCIKRESVNRVYSLTVPKEKADDYGDTIVLLRFKPEDTEDEKLKLDSIINELLHDKDPVIGQLYSAAIEENGEYELCDFMPGGDLRGEALRMLSSPAVSYEDRMRSAFARMTEMIAIVKKLQNRDKPIIFPDLKLSNFFIGIDNKLYLSDIKTLIRLENASDHVRRDQLSTTPAYQSPECANAESSTFLDPMKAVVYTLGAALHEYLTGESEVSEDGQRLQSSDLLTLEGFMKGQINGMMSDDPNERPTIDALESDFATYLQQHAKADKLESTGEVVSKLSANKAKGVQRISKRIEELHKPKRFSNKEVRRAKAQKLYEVLHACEELESDSEDEGETLASVASSYENDPLINQQAFWKSGPSRSGAVIRSLTIND
jgi:hypothetical protein